MVYVSTALALDADGVVLRESLDADRRPSRCERASDRYVTEKSIERHSFIGGVSQYK